MQRKNNHNNKTIHSEFINNIISSGWLGHLRNVLKAAELMRKAIVEEQASVMVHCSDGWDRTAQLSSLAQLCIDPYYRNFERVYASY